MVTPPTFVSTVCAPSSSGEVAMQSPVRRDRFTGVEMAGMPRAARRTLRARRVVLVLMLNGCHTWRRVELTPTRAFPENERVRVVRSNGSKTVLIAPRVVDDSLVSHRPNTGARTAIPIADIRRAETRHLSTGRTVLLVVGIAVAVYLAVGAWAASQMTYDLNLAL
jgi:hypothetical protein